MRLKTNYLGFELENPLIPSASPLSREADMVIRLEDAGAPAIVMYSLFEEEVHHEDAELEHYLSSGGESFAEAMSYFPEPEETMPGAEAYMDQIRKIKESVDIPVIASINGVSISGWLEYAKRMQDAGADALELNVYYIPTKTDISGSDVKKLYVDILREIKRIVTLPVAMKISPYFSALPAFAKELQDAGADALVLFNRFYQLDINLEKLEVESNLHLSTSDENRLPLRWIACLKDQLKVDLAATTGIHTAKDVLKLTMAGADVTMLASVLLKEGPEYLRRLKADLIEWMDEFEYESLDQMRGSMSMKNVPDSGAFMRANYIKMLREYKIQI